VTAAASGLDTTLTIAIPSSPIIFSKSTNPRSLRFTFPIEEPKYVPFQFDLRMSPQYGRGGSDVVMCKKTESVLDSRMVYAFSLPDGHQNARRGKSDRLTCCAGRIVGGNWPVAKM
jgi:hypothetical protein